MNRKNSFVATRRVFQAQNGAPLGPLAGLRGPTSEGRGRERGEGWGMPHLCRVG